MADKKELLIPVQLSQVVSRKSNDTFVHNVRQNVLIKELSPELSVPVQLSQVISFKKEEYLTHIHHVRQEFLLKRGEEPTRVCHVRQSLLFRVESILPRSPARVFHSGSGRLVDLSAEKYLAKTRTLHHQWEYLLHLEPFVFTTSTHVTHVRQNALLRTETDFAFDTHVSHARINTLVQVEPPVSDERIIATHLKHQVAQVTTYRLAYDPASFLSIPTLTQPVAHTVQYQHPNNPRSTLGVSGLFQALAESVGYADRSVVFSYAEVGHLSHLTAASQDFFDARDPYSHAYVDTFMQMCAISVSFGPTWVSQVSLQVGAPTEFVSPEATIYNHHTNHTVAQSVDYRTIDEDHSDAQVQTIASVTAAPKAYRTIDEDHSDAQVQTITSVTATPKAYRTMDEDHSDAVVDVFCEPVATSTDYPDKDLDQSRAEIWSVSQPCALSVEMYSPWSELNVEQFHTIVAVRDYSFERNISKRFPFNTVGFTPSM